MGLDVEGMRDPLEDQLLEGLEELAQKTDVLAHWADEMYNYVKAIPKSESTRRLLCLYSEYIDTTCRTSPGSEQVRAP